MNQRLRLTAILLSLALLAPVVAAAKTHKSGKSRSSHSTAKGSKRVTSKTKKPRGQAAMNPERVREIQSALIREKYMDGEPNGVWDSRSKAAMQKFQADQGWQSKVVPDSRALIKLGLGPDHANLLNPETAAVQSVPGGGQRANLPIPEQ
ncbi:MAG TPA: peptidoglycan-binding domain-containing protein [Terriglobia bacterium]|nr:peptidoglycan-binding domain-containing protein [Terriglobia bacterium]